jgi:UDP-2,4-diacetamido-2,4,6-trideoxy-beta-L-altropyranose hydrolase
MPLALFRFDVSPAIGAGHMARCIALADRLEMLGFDIACAVNAEGLSFLPALRKHSAIGLTGNDTTTAGEIRAALSPRTIDLAVCDSYDIDAQLERTLADFCGSVIAIDDLANRPHACDLLVDSAPGQPAGRYDAQVTSGTPLLLGPSYALLRAEFLSARMRTQKAWPAPAGSVLISLGATDPDNATQSVLDALDGLPELIRLTVVLGAGAPHVHSIRERLDRLRTPARLLSNVTDMAALLLEHTVAIGASGTSALERAALGMPQVLIETAANQRLVAKGLADSGAALAFGPAADVDMLALRGRVIDILTSKTLREGMSAAGRGLVDGRGVARVAAHSIVRLRTADGRPLVARRIAPCDSDAVLEWQRDPSTRRHFRNPAPPTDEEHARFMESRCRRVDAVTEILTLGGAPVAMIRADPLHDGEYEVSIVVAPSHRGNAIGSAALAYLDRLLAEATLIAEIDARNTASMTLFARAGYGASGRRRSRTFGAGQHHDVAGTPTSARRTEIDA